MYTWTNKEENELWEANYAECCKHKWTIEKWIKIDGSWKRTKKIVLLAHIPKNATSTQD